MKIIEFIKNEFTTANYLNRLIYINVIIFLIINIFSVGASLFLIETSDLIEKLMLPSEITELIKQPWSLLTYMFLHENFIHLLSPPFLELNGHQNFFSQVFANNLIIEPVFFMLKAIFSQEFTY